jgi:hypothetical protein
MAGFFFNVAMGLVAAAAFYNIYKGRNPGAGGKAAKGGKSSSSKGSSWFNGGGMGGMG